MQDSSKVLMGSTASSDRNASEVFASDPATFLAGLAVRRKSDSTLSVAKADGEWAGVSLGRSLSNHKKTAVLRCGLSVPMLAELKRARCTVTISSYANLVSGTPDTLAVAGVTFTAQSSAVTLGQATFRAATSNNATATSLAAQINAHATASALVIAVASNATVKIYAKSGGAAGNDIAVAYTDNDTNVGITIAGLSGGKLDLGSDSPADINYATHGSAVYVNDSTGKADISDLGTVSGAIYKEAPLTGIDEDGNSVGAVLVDMVGGL